VALTVSGQLVGQMAGRFSARIVSTAGLICTSIGVLGMSLLGTKASYPYMVGVLILAGVGGGLFHPPNNSSVLGGVPPQDLGGANGFFTTARNFGQAIGAALAAAILGHGLGPSGAAEVLALVPGAMTRWALPGRLRPGPGVRFPSRCGPGAGGRRDIRAARERDRVGARVIASLTAVSTPD